MEKVSCESCEYYVPYYCIKEMKLQYVHKGYCTERYLPAPHLMEIPYIYNCPCWKKKEGDIDTERSEAELAILELQQRLNDLLMILKTK